MPTRVGMRKIIWGRKIKKHRKNMVHPVQCNRQNTKKVRTPYLTKLCQEKK